MRYGADAMRHDRDTDADAERCDTDAVPTRHVAVPMRSRSRSRHLCGAGRCDVDTAPMRHEAVPMRCDAIAMPTQRGAMRYQHRNDARRCGACAMRGARETDAMRGDVMQVHCRCDTMRCR